MFPSTCYALSLVLALLAPGATAQVSPAAATPSQELRCTATAGFASFSVTLDYSGWAPGSGYFTPTHASINDNYHNGQLTCVGSTLKEGIHCVGYDNGVYAALPPLPSLCLSLPLSAFVSLPPIFSDETYLAANR